MTLERGLNCTLAGRPKDVEAIAEFEAILYERDVSRLELGGTSGSRRSRSLSQEAAARALSSVANRTSQSTSGFDVRPAGATICGSTVFRSSKGRKAPALTERSSL